MSGTLEGGQAAAQKNKERYGHDYYSRIGKLGGAKSRGGGFTSETARIAGAIGGSRSKRTERSRRKLATSKR